ncbi:MAG TPA: DUF4238 domain-containing protein [Phycisphaerae bacterium]|nr:DUF4238 domain-containing protein [Phycisphaerae bacterium]
MVRSRRHHYIAQFYLRNFANPLFSDKIHVYERASGCWQKRTPRGVGWFPHLYSMLNQHGERTDDFERFLSEHIETPAGTSLRRAAQFPESLSRQEREAVAMFMGITAARTPAMMGVTVQAYFDSLPTTEVNDLDAVVSLWCSMTGRMSSDPERARREFMKPSAFGAILVWAVSLRDRLLEWTWTWVRTTPDQPFVTSDWPVYAEYVEQNDLRLLSFPLSSEVALVVNNSGMIRQDRDALQDVRAMNRRTMERASEFIVCRQPTFLGDEDLRQWAGHA